MRDRHPLTFPSPPDGERDSKIPLPPLPSGERVRVRGSGSVRGARIVAMIFVATALLWTSAAPGGDPEVPEKYIKVDQVKAMQDAKKRVTIIDVRDKDQYDELHIKGARNVPLRELPTRLTEVPKREPVVHY
jgi:hypothetical protein